MDFRFTEEQEEFRKEVREFLAAEREKVRKQPRQEFPYQFYSDLGKMGWLGICFPKEYGGQERSLIFQMLLLDELLIGAPEPVWTAAYMVSVAGAGIIAHGSEEFKKRFIPPMIRGEIKVCAGYTEPDTASDMTNVQVRAIEDGNDFIVNGTKLYNDAYLYEYALTLVRTDPVPGEKGTSFLMIDLSSPGVTINPIWTMWGYRRNELNFADVRVPKRNLMGERGKGWYYLVTTLKEAEWRVHPTVAQMKENFDLLVDYVKKNKHQGKWLREIPSVRHTLADLALDLQIAELLYYRTFWRHDKDNNRELKPTVESAMGKLYVGLLNQRLYEAMIDITGQYGQLARTGEAGRLTPMRGYPAVFYQYATSQIVAGFTSEMQREHIAAIGLGLPIISRSTFIP